MSSHLQWMVVRNNSAFLIKGAHCHSFSTETNNLKGKNSFRYNGLVHDKSIGVNLSADKKGVVMTTKKQNAKLRPAKSVNTVTFKQASGPRRVLSKIRNTIRKTGYRKDLKTMALRRASALMNGQKTRAVPAEKKSVGMIIASFFIGSVGLIGNGGKCLVNAFDSDHLQERYELITLIFTGELCFAAGKPGNKVASNGVLSMGFVAFLLTFKSHPLKGQIKFWARSVLHSVAGLFLYAGVFCAIPAMGSAFARVIGGSEHLEDEEEREGSEGKISAGDLLCFSAGAFMVFSAMINLINVDPKGSNAPMISSANRGLLRIFTGILIWSLAFLIPEDAKYKEAPLATVLVPIFALVSTSIEIWAVGSLRVAI